MGHGVADDVGVGHGNEVECLAAVPGRFGGREAWPGALLPKPLSFSTIVLPAIVTLVTGWPSVLGLPAVSVGATGAVPMRTPSNFAFSIRNPATVLPEPPGPTIWTPFPVEEEVASIVAQ